MGKFIKNKKIIFCLIIVGILAVNSTVLALQVDWPDSPLGTPLNESSELPQLIQYLYEWGIALGGLAAFIALLTAGFLFLTSAGNPTQMSEAKSRIQSAVIGLVLLLGSWLILHTINPELTTFKPLVMPEPGNLFGNCEFYYEIDPETGEKKEPPIQRESPQQYCKDNFGDDYECKDNVCTIDLAKLFEVVNCDSISIRKEDGTEATIILGSDTTAIELQPREKFGLKAKLPDGEKQCMANLILYERTGLFGGCGGDKRILSIQPGTVSYDDTFKSVEGTDILVRCIKLEKI